ncbi:hypothetical protein Mapa_005071 [Marchantia paleacea]|nr:hypothetical protein Mapa_005071 [Marchantia paleacea]
MQNILREKLSRKLSIMKKVVDDLGKKHGSHTELDEWMKRLEKVVARADDEIVDCAGSQSTCLDFFSKSKLSRKILKIDRDLEELQRHASSMNPVTTNLAIARTDVAISRTADLGVQMQTMERNFLAELAPLTGDCVEKKSKSAAGVERNHT